MTPEQLKKKPFKPIFKIKQHEKLDTEEGESNKDEEQSTTSMAISEEDSTSAKPTETTKGSKSTEMQQVHNVLNESTHNENNTYDENSVIEIEPPTNNGEQNNAKQDKLLTTNFQDEMEN